MNSCRSGSSRALAVRQTALPRSMGLSVFWMSPLVSPAEAMSSAPVSSRIALALWPQTPWAVRKALASAGRRAKVARFCIHDLRRTFATRAASGGYPMPMLKDVLGHSSMETTSAYYVHTSRAERARRLAVVDLGTDDSSSGTQKGTQSACLAANGKGTEGWKPVEIDDTLRVLTVGSGRSAAW